jgi:hypothetical protein
MNVYQRLIEKIFLDRYKDGATEVDFARVDLAPTAEALGVDLPANLGDVIYAIRYRVEMPEAIVATASEGKEWVIVGAGRAKYRFRMVAANRIVPNENLVTVKIPDATPEIVLTRALSDEQALLAKVRYNRLIDVFLGVTAYSLQNHLRTTVTGVGQIEIDEVYVAVDKFGRQFVLPVQAKGGADQLGVVQAEQDILWAAEKYPDLICRAIAAQFIEDDLIALFELTVEEDQVKVVEEKHYRLVPGREISPEDLETYRGFGGAN